MADAGHDAVHVSDLGLLGAPDIDVMAAARKADRTVVSADTDFGELLAIGRHPGPSVILLRRAPHLPDEQAKLLLAALDAVEATSTPARWSCSAVAVPGCANCPSRDARVRSTAGFATRDARFRHTEMFPPPGTSGVIAGASAMALRHQGGSSTTNGRAPVQQRPQRDDLQWRPRRRHAPSIARADSTAIGSRQATGVSCGPNRAILGSLVPSTSSGRRVCSHLTPPTRGRWLPSGGLCGVSAAWRKARTPRSRNRR